MISASDEYRHPPHAPGFDASHTGIVGLAGTQVWTETWCFEFGAGPFGGMAAITLVPFESQAWYWSALMRAGEPLLILSDFEVRLPKRTLEIRGEGLWAMQVCEEPLEHWTIGNEAFAIALDDPQEALGRGLGVPTAFGFDLEWERHGDVEGVADGYSVPALVHGVVLVADAQLEIAAAGRWWHRWGTGTLAQVSDGRWPPGRRAPVRMPWGHLEMILTEDGWQWSQIAD